MTHARAVRELCALLQRTFDRYSPVEIFRGFVTACHLALDDLPAHLHYAATGGRDSIAHPESAARWAREIASRFRPETVEAFAHGFALLLQACDPAAMTRTDSVGGPDVIGEVYMDLLSGRSNKWNYRAQFFTPWNVCLMIAKMAGADGLEARFHAEVKAVVRGDPLLEALTLAAAVAAPDAPDGSAYWWWLSKAWPHLKTKIPPYAVCEPCVGSGRMLLAHAACHPLWLAQIGWIQYSGMDLDPLCVEMAKLNLRLYGITPMRLEPATLEALAARPERAGPLAPAYQEALHAPPDRQEEARAAVVDTINHQRRQQLSLFEEDPS